MSHFFDHRKLKGKGTGLEAPFLFGTQIWSVILVLDLNNGTADPFSSSLGRADREWWLEMSFVSTS